MKSAVYFRGTNTAKGKEGVSSCAQRITRIMQPLLTSAEFDT